MRHVILVPISFETNDPKPIELAIELARSTNPLKIFLVCDRKGRSLEATKAALAQLDDLDVELFVVSAKDTGIRWGAGLEACVSHMREAKIEAELLLCMPGDPDPGEFEANRPAFEAKLGDLLIEAASHDLTIGDYSIPKDPIKETWDAINTIPYIAALCPDIAVALARRAISKLRSEFFVVRLERIGTWIEPTDFPSDPTPFMTMEVLRRGGSIGAVHLGEFSDEDPGRTGVVAKCYQAVRLALDMAIILATNERHESRRSDETLEHQLSRTRVLRERLTALFRALDNSIRTIEATVAIPTQPNSKIYDGDWAKISGISYLFESSESVYEPYGPGIARMRTSRGAGLLNRLGGVAEALGRELQHHGLKWVPTDTYHVTYRDVVCDLDLPDYPATHASKIREFLKRLPNDLRSVATELSSVPEQEIRPVTFRADTLQIFGGAALVMTLAPADESSTNQLKALRRDRAQQNEEWKACYGHANDFDYTPHVTLAYFQDLSVGHRLLEDTTLLEACRSMTRDIVGDTTLTVDRCSLHGFVDMATFFKLT